MTPDEMERSIEFLLGQQAIAETRHERIQSQIGELVEQNKTMSAEMDRRDRRLSAKIEKVSGGLQALKDATRDLLDHAGWTDARLTRLEQPEG